MKGYTSTSLEITFSKHFTAREKQQFWTPGVVRGMM